MVPNSLATRNSSSKDNSFTTRIAQPKSGILLRTKGSLYLPIEVCLKVVEEVITADPKVGSWALMSLSKVGTKDPECTNNLADK